MKKLLAMLLCLVMIVSCVSVLASCDKGNSGDDAKTEAPAQTTEAPADETTTPADETTTPDEDATTPDADETTGEGEDETEPTYTPSEDDVVITSVEDLLAFAKSVNEDYMLYDTINVIFEADIDLTGHEWTPLYGDALWDVTFVGNGHTISNMNINYNVNGELTAAWDELLCGAGFVGVSTHNLYFQDLSFDNCYIKAYERYTGCVVGRNFGGYIEMENVKVTNFKVDGWIDIDNKVNEDGMAIDLGMRIGGIMGASHGQSLFDNCHVENIELTGFHNLAGIVGYDQGGVLDEYAFLDCTVKNARFNFNYFQSPNYDVNQDKKFVSVFCNFAGYVNKTEYCVEMGCSYEGVSYYDMINGTEYLPGDFVTPEVEEEAPAA